MISEKEMMVDERRRIQEINKIRETTKEEIGKTTGSAWKWKTENGEGEVKLLRKRWKGMNASESNAEIE